MNDSDKSKAVRLAMNVGELSDFLAKDTVEVLAEKGIAMLEIAQGREIERSDSNVQDVINRLELRRG